MKPLLIVVGAGASYEFGLPTGDTLKDKIATALNFKLENGWTIKGGDSFVLESIRHVATDLTEFSDDLDMYFRASRQIVAGLGQAISIDNYLDAHRGNRELEICGKLAIARCILAAERNSILYNSENDIDFRKCRESWIYDFFQLLTENCSFDDLIKRLPLVSFIIFNYDRCIEHYLFQAIKNYYRITESDAKAAVDLVNFHHPYGKAANLSWQGGDLTTSYGGHVNSAALARIARSLRTFTEGISKKDSNIDEIRREMNKSERILFLGFAYHKLNLNLLGLNEGMVNLNNTKIHGTAYGISDNDCEKIKYNLTRLAPNVIGPHFIIENRLTSKSIFYEYRRSLSFS